MNLINTNYAIAKGPSFAAQLKLDNKNSSLKGKQIEQLNQLAKRIGSDSDTIEISVSESRDERGPDYRSCEDQIGDPLPADMWYQFSAKATLGGETTEVNEDKRLLNEDDPYKDLKSYLVGLQRKASPVPIDKLPGKIEDLKKELAAIEKDANAADAEMEAAKQEMEAAQKKYHELVASQKKARKSDPLIIAREATAQVIRDEIGRLEKRLEQYKKIVNDE